MTLPDEAVIINKPFSFYETYKEIVLGTLAVAGALLLLNMVLFINIRRRRAVEQVLQQANSELSAMYSKISAAEKTLLTQYDELKAKDGELRESELRFRLAAAASDNGFFDLDLATGDYLFVSHPIHETFRHFVNEATNIRDLLEHIHPDDIAVRANALASYLRGDSTGYEVEYRMKYPSDRWGWVLARGQAIRDTEGRPVRLVGAVTDITYLKEASVALGRRVEERTRELTQAMAELEAFTFTVSHDIKSPLRAIAGYARFLKDDNSHCLHSDSLAMLSNIQSIASDMIELVNKLLEYAMTARLPLKIENVDMGSLFTSVQKELEAQHVGRHVDIKMNMDLPLVRGDRVLLREVCSNILANAFKFTRSRRMAQISIQCQRTANEFVFSVHDNGVGFDQQYANKLFGIFERLHTADEFPGHGIGLATVQKIIQKHGGRTWIKGELDQGATVSFSLPVNLDE